MAIAKVLTNSECDGGGALRPHRHAFTLVELLAVLAVLAVLVAMIGPALQRAYAAGQQADCAQRMRQLGTAVTLYAADHDHSLPRSQHSAFTHGESVWSISLAPYLGGGGSKDSALKKTAYRCPTDRRSAAYLSYGVNVYFELGPDDDYDGKPQTWRHLYDVPKPSGTVLFAENNSEADHIMPNFWVNLADAEDVASRRHRGVANYTFVDGHVESRPFNTIYQPPNLDRWHPARVP